MDNENQCADHHDGGEDGYEGLAHTHILCPSSNRQGFYDLAMLVGGLPACRRGNVGRS